MEVVVVVVREEYQVKPVRYYSYPREERFYKYPATLYPTMTGSWNDISHPSSSVKQSKQTIVNLVS